jgi:hypothetical protein
VEENLISEKRLISSFSGLKLSDHGQVTVRQGPKESLTIEAEPELMPKIRSDVKNDTLHLKLEQDWMDRLVSGLRSLMGSPIKYMLTVKRLNRIYIGGKFDVIIHDLDTKELAILSSGLGHVEMGSLQAERLDVALSGRAKFIGSGNVIEQTIQVSGSGDYLASQLQSKRTTVQITGHGSAQVWADKSLDVEITGLGQVQYTGDATVKPTITGLGSVTSLGHSS